MSDRLGGNMGNEKSGNQLKWARNLGKRWQIFLILICDPFCLLFLVVSILLFIYSRNQTDPTVISLLTLILSVLTGLLGGIYTKRWDDLTEEKLIVARGKSATRSLQLILESTLAFESRVTVYLKRFIEKTDQKQENFEVIKTYLEEIIGESVSLEQRLVNSIQDWTDIVPEADIESGIKIIRELKDRYAAAQGELQNLIQELKTTQEKSAEEKAALGKKEKELIDRINRLQQEVREKSSSITIPSISGSLISGGTVSSNLDFSSYPGMEALLKATAITLGQIASHESTPKPARSASLDDIEPKPGEKNNPGKK